MIGRISTLLPGYCRPAPGRRDLDCLVDGVGLKEDHAAYDLFEFQVGAIGDDSLAALLADRL